MRRAPVVEDWSRFNRAVLDVADRGLAPAAQKQPALPQPTLEPTELVSERGDHSDSYGLIARHKWRRHA